jgi:hypothetical protein
MVVPIEHKGELLALIIPASFREPGVHFVTPPEFSQQLAYMHHPAGKQIAPHVHNDLAREVRLTQEVLLIKNGRLRVDLYSNERDYLESWELGPGDVILLAGGGHGFAVLEDVEMFEVKQGPYGANLDKICFTGVGEDQVKPSRRP